MGCISNIDNTTTDQKNKIKNYILAIEDVKSMDNKIKNNEFPLECYLISAKSIEKFLKIILMNTNIDDIDIFHDLKDYILETNIKVYDDINTCKYILEKEKDKNKFIIAGDVFFKCMEIKKGKKIKLENEDSQIKIIFENTPDKIIIEPFNKIIYQFKAYEKNNTNIEQNNSYVAKYDNANQKDSFLLKCIINFLTNNDSFRNIYTSNEQNIRLNKSNFVISNLLLDIIKNEENVEKTIANLHEIISSKNMMTESKFLISPLIKALFEEFNGSNLISDLFYLKEINFYKCQYCNSVNEINNNLKNCLEFNLEKVRELKLNNVKNSFLNIDIDDCLNFYELNSKSKGNYYCQICKNNVFNGDCFSKVKTFPQILIIILDREKDENWIEFKTEFSLNLSKISYYQNNIDYDLIGIVSYKKEEGDNKQFYNTVFCKTSDDKWIFFDKYIQKEINDMKVDIIHTPYILFFLKK